MQQPIQLKAIRTVAACFVVFCCMISKGHESLTLSSVVSMRATVITGIPTNEGFVHDEAAVLRKTMKEIPCITLSHSISIFNRTWLYCNACVFHKKRRRAVHMLLNKTEWQVATVLLTGVLWHQNEDAREYQFVTGWTEQHLRIFFFFFCLRELAVTSIWLRQHTAFVTLSATCKSVCFKSTCCLDMTGHSNVSCLTRYSYEHHHHIFWVPRSKFRIWDMSCDRMHGSQ